MHRTIKSVSEMASLAEEIAEKLNPGDILALQGDLGSGKTTFTQQLAKCLGVNRLVTSPTFVIMKKYDVDTDSPIKTIFHLDCYRLGSNEDTDSLDLRDVLSSEDSIFVIEWPEKIWRLICNRAKIINFRYIDENTRDVEWT